MKSPCLRTSPKVRTNYLTCSLASASSDAVPLSNTSRLTSSNPRLHPSVNNIETRTLRPRRSVKYHDDKVRLVSGLLKHGQEEMARLISWYNGLEHLIGNTTPPSRKKLIAGYFVRMQNYHCHDEPTAHVKKNTTSI